MDSKTLREKEKLLVTSNFSFSHSVFKRLVLQTRKNQGLFGKGLKSNRELTLYQTTKIWLFGYTRFNTTLTAKGRIMTFGDTYVSWHSHTSVNTTLFPPTTFSHASAEVRGENMPERKLASTGSRTDNHQVMSPTLSPVTEPSGQGSKNLELSKFPAFTKYKLNMQLEL